MRPIGFSTGALAFADFRRGLALTRKAECAAVELSALRQAELFPQLPSSSSQPELYLSPRTNPDNRFLECAEAAEADYLVTGNTRHFPRSYQNTQIVSGRRLLDILAESEK